MRSSRAPRRCWSASMRHRRTAISWRRSSIVMPTPGACACSTPPSGGCGRITPSPMPGGACAPGSRQPGVIRRATATCSTSSASAGASPIRCRVSPKGPRRGARRCRPGPASPDNELPTSSLPPSWRWPSRPRRGRLGWPADIQTLLQWLRYNVLALAGPDLATRRELFDFIVAELMVREPEDARRIRPVRVALQNQRDDLLAFAGVLDAALAAIARTHAISEALVREACMLHRLPTTSPAYWQSWSGLRARMGGKFHVLFDAVRRAMADTPRSSALVENLNSRLRTYFTLRRHLGGSYLDLLRFFLNHRRFVRSRHAERQGKSPRELMTDQGHPHWLTLLGLGPLQPQRA